MHADSTRESKIWYSVLVAEHWTESTQPLSPKPVPNIAFSEKPIFQKLSSFNYHSFYFLRFGVCSAGYCVNWFLWLCSRAMRCLAAVLQPKWPSEVGRKLDDMEKNFFRCFAFFSDTRNSVRHSFDWRFETSFLSTWCHDNCDSWSFRGFVAYCGNVVHYWIPAGASSSGIGRARLSSSSVFSRETLWGSV